ncbi:inhibitor of nuclear factor kappa-B kinase subunit alpha [Cephus cinctus]|uniref:IkappaB kinase n=1 Tax=Cephus cinctus TaxID=211228 RepID=A0AAJ7FK03_CEPCN|nr:inhibitor of nuclear factor kappa-B kinase subunit alpha [Cephus cinctus]XP_015595627.1 inhibitor of nuclear factor kappa-B kinase subunit alpha [Cephus cinctus]
MAKSESSPEWILERILGSGGFGEVQLWRNVSTDKKIALKKCKWDITRMGERQKERWVHEVEIMNRLKHPNIVGTESVPIDLFKDTENSLPVLCMEYCSQGDLRNMLNQSENCCGITEPEAMRIMGSIAAAVEYLHNQHITHRDLKPENVVLQEHFGKIIYKLIDLGYAKDLGEASLQASKVGTMNYVAPELLWQNKYSCSVDYWSLGILFYEILTGNRPFLPHMNHTPEWVKHIRHKTYDQIRARRVNGDVIFDTDIENPTDLSKYVKAQMVDWLRLVLQWDPKRRGKMPNDQQQIAVFKMLRLILSKPVLYVFIVSMYRMEPYAVDVKTSTQDLLGIIERNTKIPHNKQILTDFMGNILKSNSDPILQKLKDPYLIMFEIDRILLEKFPNPDIPEEIQKIIEQPKIQISHQSLRHAYASTVFFVKQEFKLFRSYIIAFSIKIDLINEKLNKLFEVVKKTMSDSNVLMTEVTQVLESLNVSGTSTNKTTELEGNVKKIKRVSEAVRSMKSWVEKLMQMNKSIREFSNIDWTDEFSKMYDKVVDIYETLKKSARPGFYDDYEDPTNSSIVNKRGWAAPTEMAKLVLKFIRIRHTQLHHPSISTIAKQILQLDGDLIKLEKALNSASTLTNVYRGEFQHLLEKQDENLIPITQVVNQDHSTCVFPVNSMKNSSMNDSSSMMANSTEAIDNVIYDNIVISYMLRDFMMEMQQKYFEIINLNP